MNAPVCASALSPKLLEQVERDILSPTFSAPSRKVAPEEAGGEHPRHVARFRNAERLLEDALREQRVRRIVSG